MMLISNLLLLPMPKDQLRMMVLLHIRSISLPLEEKEGISDPLVIMFTQTQHNCVFECSVVD